MLRTEIEAIGMFISARHASMNLANFCSSKFSRVDSPKTASSSCPVTSIWMSRHKFLAASSPSLDGAMSSNLIPVPVATRFLSLSCSGRTLVMKLKWFSDWSASRSLMESLRLSCSLDRPTLKIPLKRQLKINIFYFEMKHNYIIFAQGWKRLLNYWTKCCVKSA